MIGKRTNFDILTGLVSDYVSQIQGAMPGDLAMGWLQAQALVALVGEVEGVKLQLKRANDLKEHGNAPTLGAVSKGDQP